MSATLIHQSEAYELSFAIDTNRYGHHLKFVSLVPTARHPTPHVQFQATLSTAELQTLHDKIGQILDHGAARPDRHTAESGQA